MKAIDHELFLPARRPLRASMADIRGRSLSALSALVLHGVAAGLLLKLAPPAPPERPAEQGLRLFTPTAPVPPTPPEPENAPSPHQAPAADPASPPAPSTAARPHAAVPAAAVSTPIVAPLTDLTRATTPAPPVAVPPPPAPPPPIGPDAENEARAYQQRLWAQIARARPPGIRLAGASLVSFRLDREGRLLSLHLARSSGTIMLDRLALRTVARAAPFPPPPATFDEAALAFTIAFSFR